jgi:beta-aspartyl-peptidase (threonine type)
VWLAALLLLACGACSAQAPDAVRSEVQQFVRSYVDATNKADVTAIMDMFSQNSGTSKIDDGSITRGWEAIRTSNDAMVGKVSGYKMALGSIDVLPLGAANAVATAPVTITTTTDQGSNEAEGAMTLVLEKSPKGWKILHEHYSSQPQQEGD